MLIWVARVRAENPALKANWAAVASSNDGTKLIAAQAYDASGNLGGIFTSVDSGATWLPATNAPAAVWSSVASSGDGTKLFAAPLSADANDNVAQIVVSVDSGLIWAAKGPTAQVSLH